MVGLQPVHGRFEVRRRPPDGREQYLVLGAVVGVQELAVAETVRPQLEQRPSSLQIGQPVPDLSGRHSAGRSDRKLARRDQVAAQHLVDPAQLVCEGVGSQAFLPSC